MKIAFSRRRTSANLRRSSSGTVTVRAIGCPILSRDERFPPLRIYSALRAMKMPMRVLKYDVPTPALLLDLERLEFNILKMQTAVAKAGKQLRPHAKAHKCVEIARRQVDEGAAGV